MDRGFTSTDNAEFMRANGYPFILGAESGLKAIQQTFVENKQLIQNAQNYILSEKVYRLLIFSEESLLRKMNRPNSRNLMTHK